MADNGEGTYEFTVTLQGSGPTPEAAWQDATDAFACDPGEPHSVVKIED
jgi:hypothetical protein